MLFYNHWSSIQNIENAFSLTIVKLLLKIFSLNPHYYLKINWLLVENITMLLMHPRCFTISVFRWRYSPRISCIHLSLKLLPIHIKLLFHKYWIYVKDILNTSAVSLHNDISLERYFNAFSLFINVGYVINTGNVFKLLPMYLHVFRNFDILLELFSI